MLEAPRRGAVQRWLWLDSLHFWFQIICSGARRSHRPMHFRGGGWWGGAGPASTCPSPGPDHQHVVTDRRGCDEGALGELLAGHVGEVDVVAVQPAEQLLDPGGDRLPPATPRVAAKYGPLLAERVARPARLRWLASARNASVRAAEAAGPGRRVPSLLSARTRREGRVAKPLLRPTGRPLCRRERQSAPRPRSPAHETPCVPGCPKARGARVASRLGPRRDHRAAFGR
jgi:hypothetical protein